MAELPKAKVAKLAQRFLPPGMKLSTKSAPVMCDLLKEFLQLVAGEAQDIVEKSKGGRILPHHIIAALQNLGFPEYAKAMEEELRRLQEAGKKRPKMKKRKLGDTGLSMEQLEAKQARLFAEAKEAMKN
mmetsp:Transcript_19621/g.27626  ORF Transcript_19621/g.27626 Transcript_19621/m.27626 type:complete len:129 (+) Transcript_19621:33-419(+)